jgi:hypothetical protein
MKYLVRMNHNILNEGNEPTSVISKGQEVTLWNDSIGDLVTNWQVSDDIALPVDDQAVNRLTYCNPKRTNW